MLEILEINSRKRRDRLHIIADILGIAMNGTLKTQIMYRANLSFAQVNEYLPFLLKRDLVAATNLNGKTMYEVTSRGLRFLHNYTRIIELLQTDKKHKEMNNSLIYTKNGNCYKAK